MATALSKPAEVPSEVMDRRKPSQTSPTALWEKYGLVSRGLRRSQAGEARFASLPRASRFREALEEGGGLYCLFGLFLAGRADLLLSPYLQQLGKIRLGREAPAQPFLATQQIGLLSGFQKIRAAPCSDVYRAMYQGRPVIFEAFPKAANASPDRSHDKSWDNFVRQNRLLAGGPEAPVTTPLVLEQFRNWLQLHADVERKRAILANLKNAPATCVTRFPRLIPELQSANSLVYEAAEGTPLDQEIQPESGAGSKPAQLLIEACLEQALLLSLVDAEAQLENLLLTSDGGLGFRSVPAFAPVPVEWHYELLQYVSSTVAGNTPRALRMLHRMSASESSRATQQQLVQNLSRLQPELKINVESPASVVALENYWRALSATDLNPPLFLQLFHRNVTRLGQLGGSGGSGSDVIQSSLWPVVARVLRLRFGELITTEKGPEWIVSSGLLLLTAMRQSALVLERFRDRDEDLSRVVEQKQADLRQVNLNQRTASLIRSAVVLVVFLLTLEWTVSANGALALLAGAAAALAAATLVFLIARIR